MLCSPLILETGATAAAAAGTEWIFVPAPDVTGVVLLLVDRTNGTNRAAPGGNNDSGDRCDNVSVVRCWATEPVVFTSSSREKSTPRTLGGGSFPGLC